MVHVNIFFIFRSDKDSSIIYIYDGRGGSDPLHKLEKLHYKPVIIIKVQIDMGFRIS